MAKTIVNGDNIYLVYKLLEKLMSSARYKEPSSADLNRAWSSRGAVGIENALGQIDSLLSRLEDEEPLSPCESKVENSLGESEKLSRSPHRRLVRATETGIAAAKKSNQSQASSAYKNRYGCLPIPPRQANQEKMREERGLFAAANKNGMPKGKNLPHSIVKKAVKEILHRNSRDVTVRSLRLQLQIALNADFSESGNLVEEIVNEINGTGSAKEDEFLKELMELKKAKRKLVNSDPASQEKQAPKIVPTSDSSSSLKKTTTKMEKLQEPSPNFIKRDKPLSTGRKEGSVRTATTQSPNISEFDRRKTLGLLTYSEKQLLKEKSALVIQCLARCFLASQEVAKRREIILLSHRANRIRVESLATRIQCAARGYICRNEYSKIQQAARSSVVTLQRIGRGSLARRRFKILLASRHCAAKSIQRNMRFFLAKRGTKIRSRRNVSALKIQRIFRGWRHRLKFQRYKYAIVSLQSGTRGFIARQFLNEQDNASIRREKKAAISFQRFFRQRRSRQCRERKIKEQKIAQDALEFYSSSVIQNFFRRYTKGKDHKKDLLQTEAKNIPQKVTVPARGGNVIVVPIRNPKILASEKRGGINCIQRKASVGFDTPKVRTAGFDHVKRFREMEKLPKLPSTTIQTIAHPTSHSTYQSSSLPTLGQRRILNTQWGRKKRGKGKISMKALRKQDEKDQSKQPKWGNNFGIRNQYGIYKA
eukprot:Stramenopile-MAST_4_protein_1138